MAIVHLDSTSRTKLVQDLLVETLICRSKGEGGDGDCCARNSDMEFFKDRLIGACQDVA